MPWFKFTCAWCVLLHSIPHTSYIHSTHRALSEVYTSKKSNLKSLVECFPRPTEGIPGLKSTSQPPSSSTPSDTVLMAMVPPADVGHSLSHEQVMPFLKKLESGRQREGMFLKMNLLYLIKRHSNTCDHFFSKYNLYFLKASSIKPLWILSIQMFKFMVLNLSKLIPVCDLEQIFSRTLFLKSRDCILYIMNWNVLSWDWAYLVIIGFSLHLGWLSSYPEGSPRSRRNLPPLCGHFETLCGEYLG